MLLIGTTVSQPVKIKKCPHLPSCRSPALGSAYTNSDGVYKVGLRVAHVSIPHTTQCAWGPVRGYVHMEERTSSIPQIASQQDSLQSLLGREYDNTCKRFMGSTIYKMLLGIEHKMLLHIGIVMYIVSHLLELCSGILSNRHLW